MKYKVNEIFLSIQTEGYHTGTLAVFVRFSGCNLNCPWCDTKNHNEGLYYTKEELEQEVEKLTKGNKDIIIVLTGGEPTLQLKEDEELFKGYYKTIETNGIRKVPTWINWITCSPKTKIDYYTTRANEYKFVFHKDINIDKIPKNTHIYMQPLEKDGKMNIEETIEFIKNNPKVKLSLQYHKIIGIQ